MKKKKLQLKDLKVKSFVTNLEGSEMNDSKGGKAPIITSDRATRKTNIRLPWNTRINAWTISEIRNDSRPYTEGPESVK
ncbi:MAG: pinensin family lanthipeptide [Saprospiraceae bacterium]